MRKAVRRGIEIEKSALVGEGLHHAVEHCV